MHATDIHLTGLLGFLKPKPTKTTAHLIRPGAFVRRGTASGRVSETPIDAGVMQGNNSVAGTFRAGEGGEDREGQEDSWARGNYFWSSCW